jgi:1-phosphatidylinositol-4-phosphate 5-kinase
MDFDDELIINEDIYIKEYAPNVFAFLRKLDNIGDDIIKESLSTEKNRAMVFKAGESQGKSGSFFFFSHDSNFIIKTMTTSDFNAFQSLFKDYVSAVSTRHNSLLARIYGVYTVKMEDIEPVTLILMGNSKKAIDKNIVKVFDLKGSFINRSVETRGKKIKNTATLKDLNLLEICKEQMVRFDDIIAFCSY